MPSNPRWSKEEEGLVLAEIYHREIYKLKNGTIERGKRIEEATGSIKDKLPGRTEEGIIQRFRLILKNLYEYNPY